MTVKSKHGGSNRPFLYRAYDRFKVVTRPFRKRVRSSDLGHGIPCDIGFGQRGWKEEGRKYRLFILRAVNPSC
jgi:hypothetical protein